jgi:hypothetical protein
MESPPTNTTSVQVHSGPPQGRTLRSSTATTANQQAVLHPRLCRCNGLCWFAPRVERRTSLSRSASDRDASPASIRFPPGNFKHSLTLFSKSFSSFPRGTCSLSVSRPYLALDGIYHPIRAAFPNNPTRRQRLVVRHLSWGRIWSQRPPPRWKVDGQSKFPKCCTHPASTNADSPQQGDNITARRHKTRNMACISADRTTLGTDDHLRSSPMPFAGSACM